MTLAATSTCLTKSANSPFWAAAPRKSRLEILPDRVKIEWLAIRSCFSLNLVSNDNPETISFTR